MAAFEILEHTADVGLRARGSTLEEVFAAATIGMAQIAGSWQPGEAEHVSVEVEAFDLEAVLVEWLGEVLYLHDTRNALLAGVALHRVEQNRARGTVSLVPMADEPIDGTQVKAVTYHGLRVERADDGYVAEVYLDV